MDDKYETLGARVAKLFKEYPQANRELVFQQMDLLQEHYRNNVEVYHNHYGLCRQENFAYNVLRANLEKGYYVGIPITKTKIELKGINNNEHKDN